MVRHASNGTIAGTGFGGGDGVAEVPASFGPQELSIATGAGTHQDKPVLAGLDSSSQVAAARLNADGSVDLPFGGGDGVASVPLAGFAFTEKVVDLAATPTGVTSLAAQPFAAGPGADMAVIRLTATGTPDITYGGGDGYVTADFSLGAPGRDFGAAFKADGTAVVVGSKLDGFAALPDSVAVAKFTATGVLDTSFDSDGKILGNLLVDSIDRIDSVVRDSSGRYVVVGTTDSRSSGTNEFQLLVARYTAAGAPDASFSGDGRAVVAFGLAGFRGTDIAIDGLGRIVVVGSNAGGQNEFATEIIAARFNTNGDLDATFGGADGDPAGIASVFSNNQPPWALPSVAVDSLNRVVIGSAFPELTPLESVFRVYRLTATGVLDTAFSGDGIADQDLGGQSEFFTDVAIAAGDKILAVGESDSQLAIARFTTGGILDTTFSSPGTPGYDVRLADPGESTDFGLPSMVLDSAGMITVAGGNSDVKLTRYTAAGALDPAFAPSSGGIASHDITPSVSADRAFASAVALDPAGRPIVAGSISSLGDDFYGGRMTSLSPASQPRVISRIHSIRATA